MLLKSVSLAASDWPAGFDFQIFKLLGISGGLKNLDRFRFRPEKKCPACRVADLPSQPVMAHNLGKTKEEIMGGGRRAVAEKIRSKMRDLSPTTPQRSQGG